MLRKIRLVLALFFWGAITMLFLDFTGTAHSWFGWMAKIQFVPAILALNVGVVIGLVVLTLVLGRVYCSVICPLGVMQDFFAWLGRRGKKRRNKYSYSPAISWLRYGMLGLFVIALVAGVSAIYTLIEPYSAYGRIASNILAPVYAWCNNLLAGYAEKSGSYAFYETEIIMRSITLIVAVVTLVALFILSWRNGRTYCNTICPVGTVLGFLSKYSWLKPVIDTSKCNGCGLCGRRCKAACIDTKNHEIDYSRCVACMDCIDNCHQHAISYKHLKPAKGDVKDTKEETRKTDNGRRTFITGVGAVVATAAVKAQDKVVDGGLAVIEDKKIPVRKTRIVPPGAISLRHFSQHCTACQLCVSVCPTKVLRPSTDLKTFMQPESSYELGFCRPECTKCSEVCPDGAIVKITEAQKAATQIGHAVWVKENCLPLTKGVSCGNCARKCPVGAITMVAYDPNDPESPKIPVVNDERCIGCGACENLCPSRPFSAIYVEGHEHHREI
ncbi:MAG: 4Fe-4S dicluster domain-containing protein [Muribaculaceae bacterium]|nr:4Fe-4S dicluster domain-containing protein [Muribaculaceae bacterium]